MALILATLSIQKALDAEGRPVVPEAAFTTAIVRYETLCLAISLD